MWEQSLSGWEPLLYAQRVVASSAIGHTLSGNGPDDDTGTEQPAGIVVWQVNINGAYQLPYDMEVAANLFGKQGTPFPIQINAALGLDGSTRVLVTPKVDTWRLDTVWDPDVRLAKYFRFGRSSTMFVADVFNVTNTNAAISRIRLLASPNSNRITQNVSPRILRFGVRVTF